jgi:hypothetical protein
VHSPDAPCTGWPTDLESNQSVMWLRMNAPFMNDKTRMPQLAT